MINLSILVCSLVKRQNFLDRLKETLNPQLNEQVELIVNIDNGEKTIGQKRNELLQQSSGKFLCFIDDDDLVATNYVSKILEAIQSDPDCVGLEGIITFNGHGPKKFIHSLRYKDWFEKDDVYFRNPNHLNPIKRELALQVMFPSINVGEDKDYSTRILPLLKREKFIDGPIYFYEYINNK